MQLTAAAFPQVLIPAFRIPDPCLHPWHCPLCGMDVWRSATPLTDVAARIEGDDFGILLVHSDRDSAVPIGERIRQEVADTTFGTPGQPLRLTVSVGVAGVPHDASDVLRLKEAAFGAIAEARANGGNRVATFPR